MRFNFPITLVLALCLTSCVHYSDVTPGSGSPHEVIVQPDLDDDNPDEGELSEDAAAQASDYCADVEKKSAKILSFHKRALEGESSESFQIVVKFTCQ